MKNLMLCLTKLKNKNKKRILFLKLQNTKYKIQNTKYKIQNIKAQMSSLFFLLKSANSRDF